MCSFLPRDDGSKTGHQRSTRCAAIVFQITLKDLAQRVPMHDKSVSDARVGAFGMACVSADGCRDIGKQRKAEGRSLTLDIVGNRKDARNEGLCFAACLHGLCKGCDTGIDFRNIGTRIVKILVSKRRHGRFGLGDPLEHLRVECC